MAFIADALSRVKPSPTIAISTIALELKAAGRSVADHPDGERLDLTVTLTDRPDD